MDVVSVNPSGREYGTTPPPLAHDPMAFVGEEIVDRLSSSAISGPVVPPNSWHVGKAPHAIQKLEIDHRGFIVDVLV
tara:strand:- start:3867 stop:4097 length:231 start_codon:yes stop_codon:yes gene_type:complete